MSESVLPMFSSRSFIVSGLTFNRLLDSVGEGKVGCFKRTASKHVYYLG